jgi:hypothetical protein
VDSASPNTYYAPVPKGFNLPVVRNLWVAGVRAARATDGNPVGSFGGSMQPWVSADKSSAGYIVKAVPTQYGSNVEVRWWRPPCVPREGYEGNAVTVRVAMVRRPSSSHGPS